MTEERDLAWMRRNRPAMWDLVDPPKILDTASSLPLKPRELQMTARLDRGNFATVPTFPKQSGDLMSDKESETIEQIKGATRNLFDCVLCALDEGFTGEEIEAAILQRVREDALKYFDVASDLAKTEGVTIPQHIWDIVAKYSGSKRKKKG